ncbi:MAG: TetR/AcrR family transcriptional regulator [Actinomycetes bacterium]
MPNDRPGLNRAAVVMAARDIVVADGLEGLSLRRIAADLGVTAPALYAYVDDKVDLLRGVAELEFERLADRFDAIDTPDPLARIREQAVAYVNHALEDPALFRVMFLFRPDWAQQPSVDELPAATKTFALGASAIDAAMASGALRSADPLLVAISVWAAAHGAASVLLAGINLGAEYESQVVATVIDNLLAGLAAPER